MDIHVAYRPEDFDELIGQKHIVKILKGFEKSNDWPHSYLMQGRAGSGKTTTARIIANKLKADKSNILQLDAASNSSVENIRNLTSTLRYKAFGENSTKVIIIEECHALSNAAWQALLLPSEEPPEHVYFIFCTTEINKVPETIKSRCQVFNFKDISNDDLIDLLETISDAEEIKLEKKSLSLIAKESNGSAREALTLLSTCRSAENYNEVKEILESPSEAEEAIELVRMLSTTKPNWKQVIKQIKKCEKFNPESVRLMILNYVSKMLLNTDNEEKAAYLLSILDSFSKPYNKSEGLSPLLLSIGSLVFEVSSDE